jgi:hypothetical protein
VKILATGCSPREVNSQYRQIEMADVPAAMVRACRELGHEVDWRKVPLGEEGVADRYDFVLGLLSPITSLNGRHGLGFLWALDRGLPTTVFFDDWQVAQAINSYASFAGRGLKQLLKPLPSNTQWGGYFYFDVPPEIRRYADDLIRVATEVSGREGRWNRWAATCPTFAWGDRSIIAAELPVGLERVTFLDPSPIAPRTGHPPLHTKERAWVLAALMPHDYWMSGLQLRWPTKRFGTKKVFAERLATELEVAIETGKRWGSLCPPYYHAGSGWWRARYIYAADGLTVLCPGNADGEALGPAYQYETYEVEAMTDSQLEALARRQRDTLLPLLGTWDCFVNKVGEALARGQRAAATRPGAGSSAR